MSDYRVLVTGSRSTTSADDRIIRGALTRITEPARAAGLRVVIIEGDCPYGGADVTARMWAREMPGASFESYPAQWYLHGKAAGGIRNQVMVDTGAEVCVAFPAPDSVGTWDCLKRAALAGIPGRVYPITGVPSRGRQPKTARPPGTASTIPGA